jgi:purine-binding chemotaxis protein CheW
MAVEETTETHQYLTFKLDEEVFSLTITKVREVLDYTEITRVPKTPDFMRGVINVRGGVVPVVDLRVKFGMPPTPRTVNTCIIIVEVAMDEDTTVLGVLADQVEEVLEIAPQSIEAAPRIGTRLRTDFIQGMGKRDEEFIIILDIDKVFSGEELSVVQGAEEETVGA